MNDQKLRATIRAALRKKVDGKIVEPLAEHVASRIEAVLEIEAEEAESADYDPIERPLGPKVEKIKIPDKLAPPPLSESGSVVPLSSLGENNSHSDVNVRSIVKAAPPMDPAEIEAHLRILRRRIEDAAPESIGVVPDGAEKEIILKRQIDIVPDAGVVRLSYRIGSEVGSSPSTGARSTTSPTVVSPIAIDSPPSVVFTVDEANFDIVAKMAKLNSLAKFIYRQNKVAVISRTPIKAGPITLDMRAPHDDVDE